MEKRNPKTPKGKARVSGLRLRKFGSEMNRTRYEPNSGLRQERATKHHGIGSAATH